jgi:hypothetical protein
MTDSRDAPTQCAPQCALPRLSPEDAERIAVFAVMGMTGSGKSTFIQKATGDKTIVIGHKYQACMFPPHKQTAHADDISYRRQVPKSPGYLNSSLMADRRHC